jgi:tetratricopeptide (TPR) repeat protein
VPENRSSPEAHASGLRNAFVLLGLCGLAVVQPALGQSATLPTLPPDAAQQISNAGDRLMSGKLKPAAEIKSRADALYADALVTFATHQDDSQKALSELKQVLILDPDNEDALLKRANILLQTGQVEAAFEQLQPAADPAHHSTALDSLLGYTQHLRGQNDDALRLSTRALKSDPTEATSMRVLLEIAGEQDDLSGAVLHIEDILRAGGSDVPASAWLTLGRLYVEISRATAHALTEDVVLNTLLPIYQEAAAKPPPDVERLTLLATAYEDLGRNGEALRALRQAVGLEPDNVDVILRCARMEMATDQKKAALKDYEQAYKLNPDLSGLREMLGRIYLDNEKFAEAIQLLQDALNITPSDPGLEADLALAYESAHQPAQAAAWFQRCFASPVCPPEAYLKLAVFQLNDGQITKAGQTLAQARSRFPQSARVLFYQAIQNRYAKNYSAALNCLAEMRALAPKDENDVFDPNFYLESALIFSLAQKSDRIEPLLREGLTKFPDNSDLMNELAFSWADAGKNLPEALLLSRRAAELDPDNGALQDTVGWVYFKSGEVKAALPYLQRAAIMTNNDPVVLQHLGDAWLQSGRRREAIATWRRALEKAPANHDLTSRISAALAPATHAYSRSAPNQ